MYNASASAWVDEPLKFSDFLQLTQELDADPFVVLNYDSANKQDDGKSATLDQVFLEPIALLDMFVWVMLHEFDVTKHSLYRSEDLQAPFKEVCVVGQG